MPEAAPAADDAVVVEDILAGARSISEDQAALRFATQYDGRLAYCHTQGCWFEYSGSIWDRCEVPTAFAYARTLARELSVRVRAGSGDMQKLKFINAIETLASKDERIAKSAANWDRDPWLLGTPAGTVDLQTGKLRPSDPLDFITRSTSIPAARTSECPRWMNFLREATRGDNEMVTFLQQIAGYSLTGSAREQSLFFIYGPGGNGKGIFVNTIQAIMGSYATTATMNAFTAAKGERHTTDMAMLRGARLVTASETAKGQRWDQQKISALTGEDMITARFMRQDNITFKPQFTLVIIGNHKPSLDTVDDAMRRRMNLIPFEHKPLARDEMLFDKLRPEWPAILRWMIEGAMDWQEHGLQRAASVVARTEQYFYDEDTISHWLDEACEQGDDKQERMSVLFRSWKHYCRRNEEWVGNAKQFKSLLEKARFDIAKTATGPLVRGVALKPAWMMDDEDYGYDD